MKRERVRERKTGKDRFKIVKSLQGQEEKEKTKVEKYKNEEIHGISTGTASCWPQHG